MRWYLHCDTTFHPSSCKDFANIYLKALQTWELEERVVCEDELTCASAQGWKGVLGHCRALGPPSPRDGQAHHSLEDSFSAVSPWLYLWVLWIMYPGPESLQLHTNRGESYFRSRFFLVHHMDCPFWNTLRHRVSWGKVGKEDLLVNKAEGRI